MPRSEWDTRHVPWDRIEVTYATHRHAHDRPPIPTVGDRVWYRRHEWHQEPTLATVLAVQDLDDRSDPNLWLPVRGPRGETLQAADGPVMVPALDPWPEIDLEPDDAVATVRGQRTLCGHCDTAHANPRARTREARLRGAAGWLPLDWRERHVRLPSEILLPPPPPPALDRWRALTAGR